MIDQLGFKYTKKDFTGSFASGSVERACFRLEQRFPQYIWNDSTHERKGAYIPIS